MRIVYTLTDEAPRGSPRTRCFRSSKHSPGLPASRWSRATSRSRPGSSPSSTDRLDDEQRVPDNLGELGELAKTPNATHHQAAERQRVGPQLKAAIAELQEQGFPLPDYPDEPADDEQREVRARYDKVKGSAVNPVLRQGNSDRRAPASVKNYARKHPHSMGDWSSASRSHVSTMSDGDFPLDRAVGDGRCRGHGQDRALRAGSATRGRCKDRRSARRGGHAPRGARRIPRGTGRRGEGPGRPLLGPPEGHDDEGLRPDHLRARGFAPTSPMCSPSTATRSRVPA